MTFGDAVVILRATGGDEYENPIADWSDPDEFPAKAFIPGRRDKAYFPAGTDLRHGDRLRFAGRTFEVENPFTYRSPSRAILVSCGLRRLEG